MKTRPFISQPVAYYGHSIRLLFMTRFIGTGRKMVLSKKIFLKGLVPVFSVLFLFASELVMSQQLPLTSHDYMNPLLYNPAEIGQHNYTDVFLHTRRQWVGIQGAPETYTLSVDGVTQNKKVGLALIISNDVTDVISNLSASAGYRYGIQLSGNDHYLRLALMGSLYRNRINFDKLQPDNPNDQTLLNTAQSSTGFDVNAGILYRLKNMKAGLSAYQMMSNHLIYEDRTTDKSLTFSLIRHFIFMTSYTFTLNEKCELEPRLLLKSAQGMPVQVNAGAFASWQKKVWAGITWQQGNAVSFAIGGNVYSRFSIGYSFDVATGSLGKYTSGTHEIVIGIKLYNSHNHSGEPSELSPPDDDLEKLKHITKEQNEEIEKLRAENDKMKKDLANTNQNVEMQNDELKDLQKIFTKDSASIREVVNKYSTRIDQLGKNDLKSKFKKVGSAYIDTTIESSFKETKYYVVLGTFLKYTDARLLQRVLAHELSIRTMIITQANNAFFVYSQKFSDSFGVKSRIKKHIHDLEKKGTGKYIQGDIWIYKTKE